MFCFHIANVGKFDQDMKKGKLFIQSRAQKATKTLS